MATPPWKSNVGGPSDEELNRVVQAHEEQRRQEVKRLVADPEVYEHRQHERGFREYKFWRKVRGRWTQLTNITKAHTASAAVNEGSIKALRTTLPEDHPNALKGLPDRPSVAWLRRIDKNAAVDQGRTATAEKRKRLGIAWTEGVDNTDPAIPSRRKYNGPSGKDDEPADE
jgi:hypothetical protein